MLHAYMLHPRSFYQDTIRLYPELAVLRGFPLTQIAVRIDDAMAYIPATEQIKFWEAATGEAAAPPLKTTPSDEFKITCPTALILQITDPVISVAAFLNDIARSVSGKGVGVAGTLLSAEGKFDLERSTAITSKIASAVDFPMIKNLRLDDAVYHLQAHSHSMFADIEVEFLSCYGNPGGFSIDLGNAVLRQGSFASIMYHAGSFLELTMKGESAMGPTNEIDLVWHTHQLSVNYRDDLMRLFGWFLDHVDVAPSEILTSALSNADRLWENTFGTPYESYFKTKIFRKQSW
ncbi:hypothetical protein LshimejAT787_1203380 [Lyophyllum shimeji]|uniref:Uncharacterized protein n=1 Tax=Lyophyllum shimeji TaxID=47721 RepID=A0A9P3PWJ2_LYOSH|nr:hypothetical protein LshimejAT787_1203380 [Lyophyllum shimeji]